MKKLISSLLLLVTTSAIAGSPAIFSGDDAKLLKQNINLNDQAKILTGTANPTSSAQDAPQGSIYLRTGASGGTVFTKNDNGSTTNWTALSASSSSGTITSWAETTGWDILGDGAEANVDIFERRVGDCIEIRGNFDTGSVSGGAAALVMRTGLVIDTTKLSSKSSRQAVGYWNFLSTASANINTDSASTQSVLYHNGSSTSQINFTRAVGSGEYTSQAGNTLWGNNQSVSFFITCIPISGW